MRLTLPETMRARILDAARSAAPGECCGLILGIRDGGSAIAAALHPARNLEGGHDRFAIAPEDHFAARRAARETGQAVIGCYHSHPHGAARPSAADLAGAGEEDFLWLIATPAGDLAAFVFEKGRFAAVETVPSP